MAAQRRLRALVAVALVATVGGVLVVRDTPRAGAAEHSAIARVSRDDFGQNFDSDADGDAISGDGRFVAFVTSENGIDGDDENDVDDIYVVDNVTGTTTLISQFVGGGTSDGEASDQPAISADGRYVAFRTRAPYEISDVSDGTIGIWMVDRGPSLSGGRYPRIFCDEAVGEEPCMAAPTPISVFQDPENPPGETDLSFSDRFPSLPTISGDGTQIAFFVEHRYTIPCSTPGCEFPIEVDERYVMIRDLDRDRNGRPAIPSWPDEDPTTVRSLRVPLSTSPDIDPSEPSGLADPQRLPSFSDDGLHLALNEGTDVVVYDRTLGGSGELDQSGNRRVVVVTTNELAPDSDNTASAFPDISGDGSVVTYAFIDLDATGGGPTTTVGGPTTTTAGPAPGTFGIPQIVAVERDSFGLPINPQVVSQTDGVLGNSASLFPVISTDGLYVAFSSGASNFNPTGGSGSCLGGGGLSSGGFIAGPPAGGPLTLSAANAGAPLAAAQAPPARCNNYAVYLDENQLTRSPALVSRDDDDGSVANQPSAPPDISANGRFISFSTRATNLDDREFLPDTDIDETSFDVYVLEWTPFLRGSPDPVVFPAAPVGASPGPTGLVSIGTNDFGPFEIDELALLGPHDEDFGFNFNACGGETFHAGDPCQFTVNFSPTATGVREADILASRSSVLFDASGQAEIELTGTANVPVAVGSIDRASVGEPSGGNDVGELDDASFSPAISGTGRYVAFETSAPIDPSDGDFGSDIYVRDLEDGTTVLVSDAFGCSDCTNAAGPLHAATPAIRAGTSPGAFDPAISGDGRYIAYATSGGDVLLADRGAPDASGDFTAPLVITVVSIDMPAPTVNSDPSISADGTQIAFTCESPGGDNNPDACVPEFPQRDWIMIRDLDRDGDGIIEGPLDAQTIQVRPPGPEEGPRTEGERSAAISADGDHVAFVAATRRMAPGLSEFTDLIWVYDRDLNGNNLRDEGGDDVGYQIVTTGQFTDTDESNDPRPNPLIGTSSFDPSIDGDGSTIAYSFFFHFEPSITSVLPPEIPQVLVAERPTVNGLFTTTEVVSTVGPIEEIGFFEPDDCPQSVPPTTTPTTFESPDADFCSNVGDGPSVESDISDDGRYVAFTTDAHNLHIDTECEPVPPGSPDGADEDGCAVSDGGGRLSFSDVLVVDRIAPGNAGAPQLVNSVFGGSLGDYPNGSSFEPALSTDGRFVAFASQASNLVGTFECDGAGSACAIDDNRLTDIFVTEWNPLVTATTGNMLFPTTQIGFTSAAQSVQLLTVQFGPAPVIGLSIGGADPADFVINGTSNCSPPIAGTSPIAPVPTYAIVHLDTPCTATVAFRPTAVGTRSGTLTIDTGSGTASAFPGQSQVVDLIAVAEAQPPDDPTGPGPGPGTPTGPGPGPGPDDPDDPETPGFSVDPGSLDFGSQLVTVTSPQQTVTVTNTGTGPIRISTVTIEGANPGDFGIVSTDCTGRLLQPNESCQVTLIFRPTAPGERAGVLRFDDDAAGSPHLVLLGGRAPAPTLLVNPAVTIPGRTVTVSGTQWAPNSEVVLTMVDQRRPTSVFPETRTVTTDSFGQFTVRLLVFPGSVTGPRLVLAQGNPPTLTAQSALLVAIPSVNGPDFVDRG